jgi:hypothetical protein
MDTLARLAGSRGLRLAALAAAALALQAGGRWLGGAMALWDFGEAMAPTLVAACAAIYILVMALPFVPGIEIGLALMLVLGVRGIVLIYLCTQVALMLSFLAGRLAPRGALDRWFAALGLERARKLVDRGRPQAGWPALLSRRPGLALVALINLPGNALIGGAGGIGLLAGMSGRLTFPRFALLAALATTPLPLVLLLGSGR